jgi:chromosome segregation ATPase
MRRSISNWFGLTVGLLLLAPLGAAQSQPPAQQSKQPDIVEAARKAREQQKDQPKAKRVFTNDDLPKAGEASTAAAAGEATAGTEAAAGQPQAEAGAGTAAAPSGAPKLNEADWRKRFADLRAKIAAAEREADLIQRERNLNEQQYYSDPNKALREQYTRGELNEQKSKIDAKRQEIAQLKQQLADLEDELRKAGGPAGWARE